MSSSDLNSQIEQTESQEKLTTTNEENETKEETKETIRSSSKIPSELSINQHDSNNTTSRTTETNTTRSRSGTWSDLFRRNSISNPIKDSSISTPTRNPTLPQSQPTTPLPNQVSSNPTHTPNSFSLSSITLALKRPLLSTPTPQPSEPQSTEPELSSTPPSAPLVPELSPATDPDPTPSVPISEPPRLIVEEEPIEESVGAFDFNQFLDQMRWRQSEPIAKYLRSFLKEFTKRSSNEHGLTNITEQVRVVNDFLDFISIKMREIKGGPWDPRICSDGEFDHAIEAMEKLVMNRVWHLTYTPALINHFQPSATDDLERDEVLSQKFNLFHWITDHHLDLELERDESDGFLEFAKTELLKINSYKAPRDKMICILNCSKVIFGLIRHISQSEGGADTFVPILILVVLRARPEHLISNLQYIQRFRNPDKLQGENGYYLSSLNAAISFIERLDYSVLSNISQEEFEQNVEQAISTLPRSPTRSTHPIPTESHPTTDPSTSSKSTSEAPVRPPMSGSSSFPDLTRTWLFNTVPNLAEKAVSRPLNAIARIVDDLSHDQDEMRSSSHHPHHENRLNIPRPNLQEMRRASSPNVMANRRRGSRPWALNEEDRVEEGGGGGGGGGEEEGEEEKRVKFEKLKRAEHEAKLDTLCSIFNELEREVLEVVLVTHHGQLSVAIDSVLEMS
ncbi:hypothetical protein DFH28DRAFT_881177 [Melampsora americana]|nr:hypothetical protein DFH28DRAFT_881177 [Melampsora americana]